MKHHLLAFAALGLGSCTVYSPMQCAAPNIREKGELEMAATLHLNTRLEGAVTYSPVKHMLVRAAGSFKNDNLADTSHFRVRQFEMAAGGYWSPSDRWTIGGLGGYGRAHNQRGLRETGGLLDPIPDDPYRRYDSQYHTIFGEAFANFQGRVAGTGVALRLTSVQFETLTDRGTPFGPSSMLRFEPMGYGRFGPYGNKADFIQFQVAAGLS